MRDAVSIGALLGILTALAFGILAIWVGDIRWFWTGLIIFVPSIVTLMAAADADD